MKGFIKINTTENGELYDFINVKHIVKISRGNNSIYNIPSIITLSTKEKVLAFHSQSQIEIMIIRSEFH